MPRRRKPYEVVQLNVAVIYKGGAWKIVDGDGSVLAGVRDKTVTAALSGRAATAEELASGWEWMEWSRKMHTRLKGRVASQLQPAASWGRKFQAMACSIEKRRPRSDKRNKCRKCHSWDDRLAAVAEALRCRARRGGFGEWDLWAETCSRSINNREAQRKCLSKRAKVTG